MEKGHIDKKINIENNFFPKKKKEVTKEEVLELFGINKKKKQLKQSA